MFIMGYARYMRPLHNLVKDDVKPDSDKAYEYEEETRSHRFECKRCHQDVGAGNGNGHYTGESFALDIPVVCQAYIDDTRPKTANINRQTGVRADTKAMKIKLNKKLDSKIKNLVLA